MVLSCLCCLGLQRRAAVRLLHTLLVLVPWQDAMSCRANVVPPLVRHNYPRQSRQHCHPARPRVQVEFFVHRVGRRGRLACPSGRRRSTSSSKEHATARGKTRTPGSVILWAAVPPGRDSWPSIAKAMVRPDLYREWRPPNQPQTRPAGPSGRERTLFFFFFLLAPPPSPPPPCSFSCPPSLALCSSSVVRGGAREGGRGDPKRGKEEQEEGVGGLLAPRRTHTGGTGKTQARQAWGGGRHEVEPERHGENEDWRRLETAASQGQVDALPLACRYRRPETRPQPIVRGVQGLAPVLVAPPSRREAPREGYPVRKSGTGAGT